MKYLEEVRARAEAATKGPWMRRNATAETKVGEFNRVLDENKRLLRIVVRLRDAINPIAFTGDRTMTKREQQRLKDALAYDGEDTKMSTIEGRDEQDV